MNTRDKIISLLSQSKEPLRAKKIAFELKKSDANIRKILSNLCKEEKIKRVGFGDYRSNVKVLNKSVNVLGESVNVLNKSVNVEAPEAKKLINEEINKYRKAYFKRLKINDPEAYKKIREARNRYLRNWRADNPDYNRNWLSAYYKKHKEKFRIYQKRYWLKKALSQE